MSGVHSHSDGLKTRQFLSLGVFAYWRKLVARLGLCSRHPGAVSLIMKQPASTTWRDRGVVHSHVGVSQEGA